MVASADTADQGLIASTADAVILGVSGHGIASHILARADARPLTARALAQAGQHQQAEQAAPAAAR